MKKLRKMLALLLAMTMVLALGATAFASEVPDETTEAATEPADTPTGHTISVKDTDTHTYRVFQVLTGTLAEDGSTRLGNPAWGADVIDKTADVNAFIEAITASGLSEQDIAQLVAAKVNTASAGRGTVSAGNPLSGLATGYYVLVDETELTDDHALDTKALHVVQVLNDIPEIDIKWDTTKSEKEIESDTLGKDGQVHGVGDDKDNVSIGDTVNFKITGKIPSNANLYNYFYFVFNDTMDPGLTLNANSLVVTYIDGDDTADSPTEHPMTAGTDYEVKTGEAAAPKTFQLGLLDAKAHAGDTIIVRYSAVLNENATIGEGPNKNTSTVTYSDDPNHDYHGDEAPGFPDDRDKDVLGETPESQTETYTTGIEIKKVDQDGNILTGAEFTLTGDSIEIVLVSSEVFTEDADGTYYKLKNGTYTTEAPIAEDYMEVAPEGATAGYVVAEEDYEGEDVITVSGVRYRPYKPDVDTEKTVYILVKATIDQYEAGGKKYKKTITYTALDSDAQGVVIKAEVGADGVVRFVGLGSGEYTIEETKTPDGYNKISPITFTIGFDADPDEGEVHWSTTSGDATYNPATGLFEITIENNQGTELPTTGGIGTTIFTIVGLVLIIGAGVTLIVRRRMAR